MMKSTLDLKAWKNIGCSSESEKETEIELSKGLNHSMAELSERFEAIIRQYKNKRKRTDQYA